MIEPFSTHSEELDSSDACRRDAKFVPDDRCYSGAEDLIASNIFWCGSVETPIWNVTRELPPRTSFA
jgi:hypothetical protein